MPGAEVSSSNTSAEKGQGRPPTRGRGGHHGQRLRRLSPYQGIRRPHSGLSRGSPKDDPSGHAGRGGRTGRPTVVQAARPEKQRPCLQDGGTPAPRAIVSAAPGERPLGQPGKNALSSLAQEGMAGWEGAPGESRSSRRGRSPALPVSKTHCARPCPAAALSHPRCLGQR